MGFMKPFKTPSLVGKNTLNSRPPPRLDEDRPSKKRRLSNAESSDEEVESVSAAAKVLKKPKTIPKFQPLLQKPVNTVANANNSSSQTNDGKSPKGQEGYYTVLWYVLPHTKLLSVAYRIVGVRSPPRKTRRGTAMVCSPLPMATHDFRTSPAKILAERFARCHCSKDLRFRSEGRKSKSNR